jgi:hypothetical protein
MHTGGTGGPGRVRTEMPARRRGCPSRGGARTEEGKPGQGGVGRRRTGWGRRHRDAAQVGGWVGRQRSGGAPAWSDGWRDLVRGLSLASGTKSCGLG